MVAVIGATSAFAYYNAKAQKIQQQIELRQAGFARVFPLYQQLTTKTKEYKDKGVDVSEVEPKRQAILVLFAAGSFDQAETEIKAALSQLEDLLAVKQKDDQQKADEAEKQKGTLSGKVTSENAALAGVAIEVKSNDMVLASATTDSQGYYSAKVAAGDYSVKASKSGYVTYQKGGVKVTAQQTAILDISMSKATPTPIPTAKPTTVPVSTSTSNSKYEQKTVSTSRGTFTVNMITLEMGSGKARLITDTAADGDCSDNCPTLSLQNYVSRNGGFAGINGTYFCPADYADCAGKTGTFYWKIYNTRLQKVINEHNGLGEDDPAIVFTTAGTPRFFKHWKDFVSSGISVTAGINSRPILVSGHNNVLNDNDLDTKQRTTKGNRGALGVNENTFYAVVAKFATVPDLAEIMVSLGAESAMNIDGGGSSALYYKGSYKVGPGRSLPNAVIFGE